MIGDLRDRVILLLVEIEDDSRRARLSGRLFPTRLGDRQGGAAQIEQRRRLAPVGGERGIGHIGRDRALQAVGREIEIEPPLRRVIEREADPVDGVRPALRVEGDVGVEFRRDAVEPGSALDVRAGAGEVEREIAVAEPAIEARPCRASRR